MEVKNHLYTLSDEIADNKRRHSLSPIKLQQQAPAPHSWQAQPNHMTSKKNIQPSAKALSQSTSTSINMPDEDPEQYRSLLSSYTSYRTHDSEPDPNIVESYHTAQDNDEPNTTRSRTVHANTQTEPNTVITEQQQAEEEEEREEEPCPFEPHQSWRANTRSHLRHICSTHAFHRAVLTLVVVDTLLVLSQLLLELFICEDHSPGTTRHMKTAAHVIEEVSFVISCVFMFELTLTLFAFGFGYLRAVMHLVDSAIIVVGFVVDLLVKGPVVEAAKLVVILRLWRLFKMAEEVIAEAYHQSQQIFDEQKTHIDDLERQNTELKKRLKSENDQPLQWR